MRNWPLRWKVALYSAWLAVGSTVGGAITTWFVLRHAEIAAFDQRLTTDAQEFSRSVEHFEDGPTNNLRVFKEIFVRLSLRNHLVEVPTPAATCFIFPRDRASLFLAMASKEFHNHRSTAKPMIVGQRCALACREASNESKSPNVTDQRNR